MGFFGGLLSAGLGLLGAKSDRDAAQNSADQAYWRNRMQAVKGRDALAGGAAEARLYDDKGIAAIEKAAAQMRTVGVLGGQNLKNQLSMSMANVQQGMVNKGLGNTTLGANLQRGVLSDYGQNAAQFTSGVMGQQAAAGGLLSDAYTGYGQRRYGEAVDVAQSYFGTTYSPGQTQTGSASAYGAIGSMLGNGISDWWGSRGSGGQIGGGLDLPS